MLCFVYKRFSLVNHFSGGRGGGVEWLIYFIFMNAVPVKAEELTN